MRPPRRDVKVIGGKSKVIGEVTIQVSFTSHNIILYINFSILKMETTSLLCNRFMIEKGLDISLQGGYLYVDDRQQPLILDTYFYVYELTAD